MPDSFTLPEGGTHPVSSDNRFGMNYREAAHALGRPPADIIDGHSHINGTRAAEIYAEVREAFGVSHTFSQTQLAQAENVRGVLGDSVSFVAIPDYMSDDPLTAHTTGFIRALDRWHELGARMVKWWCGPRGRDMGKRLGNPMLMTLESDWRRRQMDRAAELGVQHRHGGQDVAHSHLSPRMQQRHARREGRPGGGAVELSGRDADRRPHAQAVRPVLGLAGKKAEGDVPPIRQVRMVKAKLPGRRIGDTGAEPGQSLGILGHQV